ncbi:excalibur calcium-binding domain-containing protein [Terricaulis sp.]|uniref:excalibur calcium-binding domain-containing protein n=1 Tax=Terricaulis sp. TaxID=2768686 RepID=UPI002AC6D485|nr:excalibur calcium-binding domain-containing protein [Terricaulis sp.]MDZ4690040.1 excalibur calcium-binding domain-containing protein [Terricaulis sp.]
MAPYQNRPRLKVIKGARARSVRDRFRRFGRRRVPRALAFALIGVAALSALMLLNGQSGGERQLAKTSDYFAPAPSSGRSQSGPYRNCDAARAAGAAPVRRGQAGYGAHLDRDGDGVGCEPYHR